MDYTVVALGLVLSVAAVRSQTLFPLNGKCGYEVRNTGYGPRIQEAGVHSYRL